MSELRLPSLSKKIMMLKLLLITYTLLLSGIIIAQKPERYIKEGNEFFKKGQLAEAAAAYDKVTDKKHKYTALLNKGTALYKMKKYEDAIKAYHQVSSAKNADEKLRSGAYYNTGVVYSNQNKLPESIEAYKSALRLNWQDNKARENLQKALSELPKSGGGGNEKPQESKSKLNQNQAKEQLDRLEQKEKQTQNRVAGKKTEFSGSAGKDW